MKTIKYAKLLCLSMTMAFLSSCNVNVPKEVHSSFKTMIVKQSDITIPLKYSARMNGNADVTITPQISGQLMKICVTEGDMVKAGQVLFIIDDRQAKLELEAARANLNAAIAQEKSAQLEYESNKNLYDKKIVSSYMLNTALNTYNQAKAAVAQARSAVNSAQVQLGFCTITSPVNGVVGNIPASTGMQVSPGTELSTISGNLKMDAAFSITEDEFASVMSELDSMDIKDYIKNLPEVTFVMKNGKEYEYKGHITSTTGIVDKHTGSLTCKASFPNPQGLLVSGTQGSIILPYSVKGVIVIPTNAVVKLQDKSLVYKVGTDSCAVSVQVTTVDAGTGKDVVVMTGLKPGDKIVTEGANNVHEGQKVLFGEEKESK